MLLPLVSSPRLSLDVPANWTSGTHAHIAFSPEYIYSSIPRASIDLYLLLLDSWSISSLLSDFFVAYSHVTLGCSRRVDERYAGQAFGLGNVPEHSR